MKSKEADKKRSIGNISLDIFRLYIVLSSFPRNLRDVTQAQVWGVSVAVPAAVFL